MKKWSCCLRAKYGVEDVLNGEEVVKTPFEVEEIELKDLGIIENSKHETELLEEIKPVANR